MEILEYDQVDPTQVLALNHLSLGYALTPQRAALIRKLDPRPFPCFAINAVDEGNVADARRLLGIEAGRFLISYIDIT